MVSARISQNPVQYASCCHLAQKNEHSGLDRQKDEAEDGTCHLVDAENHFSSRIRIGADTLEILCMHANCETSAI